MIHIFVIMTLHMTLYVGIGDGSFATESTDMGIFASMNLYVEVCVLCDMGCDVWLYITHFILMARNNMYFQYIFCVALLVTFFPLFLVL
jgi:hypothetical protein